MLHAMQDTLAVRGRFDLSLKLSGMVVGMSLFPQFLLLHDTRATC